MSSGDEIWLSKFVLGIAARTAREKELKEESFIISPKGKKYYVLSKIGGSKHYSIYNCLLSDDDKKSKTICLLKIAQSSENQLLETEALVLTRLRNFASEIDEKNMERSVPFNYGNFFPTLIDSFISQKQGNRRINIIGFPDPVDSPSQLTQLSSLISKENIYIDPRTSVWILGKTLKILGMAQDLDISNGRTDGSNILIEKERHGVILFDWTFSQVHEGGISVGICRLEIIQTVKMLIKAMGGDPEKGTIDSLNVDENYLVLIKKMLNCVFSNANDAHNFFYQEVEKIWKREYWPFTSIPINNRKEV